jgi:hypothetical protein
MIRPETNGTEKYVNILPLFTGRCRGNRMFDSLKAVFGGTVVDLVPLLWDLKFQRKTGTR